MLMRRAKLSCNVDGKTSLFAVSWLGWEPSAAWSTRATTREVPKAIRGFIGGSLPGRITRGQGWGVEKSPPTAGTGVLLKRSMDSRFAVF